MNYRIEIDGLRALAIIAVIINHMSKNIIPSGFLGVDMFFVISGYVITLSLYKRKNSGIGGLLLDFYVRRIKRLIPALVLFVTITSILISFFNASPEQTLKTGIASLFGLSNLYLIRSASNYFGDSAQLNTFTHTWSLGVEEQFYILFPFIIWLTGFGRNLKGDRIFYISLGILSIISVASFISLNITAPYLAYYFMPARFWELAVGSFAFWATLNSKLVTNSLALKGLALFTALTTLIVLFVPEEFIILSTISIVLLTALLILVTQPETIGYKVFSSKPMVFIGKISYSLYLWHWSVLAISRWTVGMHLWAVPIQLLMMVLIATVSYKFVENPLRKANWSSNRPVTIGYGFTAMTMASLFLLILIKPLNGELYIGTKPDMIDMGIQTLTNNYSVPGSTYQWQGEKCVISDNSQIGKVISINDCTLGNFVNAKTRIMVIGNSFSPAFVQSFDQLVSEDNYAVTITSSFGSVPVKELPNNNPWSEAGRYYWDTVIPQMLSQLKAGDWVFMINDMAELSPDKSSAKSLNRLEILRKGIEEFSDDLAKRQIRLAVLNGLPFARDANCDPSAAVDQWFTPFGSRCSFMNKHDTLERRKSLDDTLRSLANQKKITTIDLIDIFCPDEICSYKAKSGQILYRDVFSHPSVEGARLSSSLIRNTLKSATISP